MSKTENNILLFSITLCWSASYVFIKDLPPALSSYGYITMTCGIAAVILTIVFYKKICKVRLAAIGKSLFLSILLTLNLLMEKLGIDNLASSSASVIASSSILIVPVILIMMKKFPTKNNLVGAVIIMSGILITSSFKLENIAGIGALYMVLSAVVSSFYTILVDKIAKEEDPIILSIMQMWISALLSFVLWYIENPSTFASVEFSNEMLSSIFILAFFAKAYAYVALMYSQKYSDPISVTIIASTEPVVALVLAVLIPTAFTEHLTTPSVIGASIIMLGAIVSGTNFFSGRKVKQ